MSRNQAIAANETKLTRDMLLQQIGENLRQAREEMDISKDKVAHNLKLRLVYIQALESGDWTDLPEEVYALGFLRQYAKHLHVDIREQIEQLKSKHYQLTKPLTFPDPPVAPSKSWVVIAALAFLLLFIGFNVFWSTNEEIIVASQVATPTAASNKVDKSLHPKMDESIPTTSLTQTTYTAAVESTPPVSEQNIDDYQQVTPVVSNDTATAIVNSPITFTFKAVGDDVWLQVFANKNDKKPIRASLLKAGETLDIEVSNNDLWITCGNTSALQISSGDSMINKPGSFNKNIIRKLHIQAPQ